MANVVEIVIKGNDQSSAVMDRAATTTKRLQSDMKSLGGTVGQVGNAFAIFGNTQVASALNSIESAVISTRSFAGELSKSKLAVVGLGVAAVTAGYQVGEFIRQWIPFFNQDILIQRETELNKVVEETLRKRLALRDAQAAADKDFIASIDAQIIGVEKLKGSERSKAELVFQLEALKKETLEKNAKDRDDKELKRLEDGTAKYQEFYDGIIFKIQELGNAEVAEIQAAEERNAKRLEQAREFYNQGIIDEQEFSGFVTANYDLYEKEKTRITKEQSDKRKAIFEAERRSQLLNLSAYASSTASILGSVATIVEATGKKNFKLAQGLRYAEAVVSTAAGIARAYADHPWPLSAVVSAAVAAAGAAQIAVIASAKPPQAHGGASYIPEESTYLLSKGERVLSPRQNEDLTSFMEGGRGGGSNGDLYIDGAKIGQVLWDMSRAGRLRISSRAIV